MEWSLNEALGESIYATTLAPMILGKLVKKGVLSVDEVVAMLDGALLVLERHALAANGPPTAAQDYARSRLEALLAYYSTMQPENQVPDAGG